MSLCVWVSMCIVRARIDFILKHLSIGLIKLESRVPQNELMYTWPCNCIRIGKQPLTTVFSYSTLQNGSCTTCDTISTARKKTIQILHLVITHYNTHTNLFAAVIIHTIRFEYWHDSYFDLIWWAECTHCTPPTNFN